MDLEDLAGQKLVLGIDGTRVSPEAVHLFQRTRAGGLILFERNFESPEGLRNLIRDLERALKRNLLVWVDHEGGRVIRFKEGVTRFPDAQAVAASGNAESARKQGEIEGKELRDLGIDINLAPVLDVLADKENPAIGNRSYGKDPEVVAAFGRARIEGLQSGGVSACAKHFPGIGAAEKDPHLELPVIRASKKDMKEIHLVPFRAAFEAGVNCVMSSHVVYPEFDKSGRAATFSRFLIHDLLRLEFGFQGVTLTDDLKMGAVAKRASIREIVPLAAAAGHDLLLICSDAEAQVRAFEALVWAYKRKELRISELEESVERIHATTPAPLRN